MPNKLTVVIPVLNEGEELATTLNEVRRTAGENVEIIVVDDASYDGLDYKSIAQKYATNYIHHNERKGSGPSKQDGIDHCQTPFFIVIDAHMRLYDNLWWQKIE